MDIQIQKIKNNLLSLDIHTNLTQTNPFFFKFDVTKNPDMIVKIYKTKNSSTTSTNEDHLKIKNISESAELKELLYDRSVGKIDFSNQYDFLKFKSLQYDNKYQIFKNPQIKLLLKPNYYQTQFGNFLTHFPDLLFSELNPTFIEKQDSSGISKINHKNSFSGLDQLYDLPPYSISPQRLISREKDGLFHIFIFKNSDVGNSGFESSVRKVLSKLKDKKPELKFSLHTLYKQKMLDLFFFIFSLITAILFLTYKKKGYCLIIFLLLFDLIFLILFFSINHEKITFCMVMFSLFFILTYVMIPFFRNEKSVLNDLIVNKITLVVFSTLFIIVLTQFVFYHQNHQVSKVFRYNNQPLVNPYPTLDFYHPSKLINKKNVFISFRDKSNNKRSFIKNLPSKALYSIVNLYNKSTFIPHLHSRALYIFKSEFQGNSAINGYDCFRENINYFFPDFLTDLIEDKNIKQVPKNEFPNISRFHYYYLLENINLEKGVISVMSDDLDYLRITQSVLFDQLTKLPGIKGIKLTPDYRFNFYIFTPDFESILKKTDYFSFNIELNSFFSNCDPVNNNDAIDHDLVNHEMNEFKTVFNPYFRHLWTSSVYQTSDLKDKSELFNNCKIGVTHVKKSFSLNKRDIAFYKKMNIPKSYKLKNPSLIERMTMFPFSNIIKTKFYHHPLEIHHINSKKSFSIEIFYEPSVSPDDLSLIKNTVMNSVKDKGDVYLELKESTISRNNLLFQTTQIFLLLSIISLLILLVFQSKNITLFILSFLMIVISVLSTPILYYTKYMIWNTVDIAALILSAWLNTALLLGFMKNIESVWKRCFSIVALLTCYLLLSPWNNHLFSRITWTLMGGMLNLLILLMIYKFITCYKALKE